MDFELLLEAERRGILPPDKVELLTEARRRGLVPSVPSAAAPAPAAPATPPGQIPGAAPGMAAPPAVSEVPMGRRVMQFVRPTVEALGTAGGAALGTPLGPAGAIGGAGLGYGLAKGGLDIAEQALGYQKAPTSVGQALERGAKDVLMGATMETGGRVAAPLIGKAVGKAMDLRQIPEQKAAKIAKESLGQDLPAVLNSLRTARPNAGVAEVTANIENPTWQALIQRSLERDPQFLRRLNTMNEAESVNALTQLAGGVTATDVRAGLEMSKRALNTLTGPQRETALNRANLGKAVAEYEAKAGKLSAEAASEVQKVRDLIKAGDSAEAWARLDLIKRGLPVGATKYTFFGEMADKAFKEWSDQAATASLDLGQGARFAQGAADALRSVGVKPLEADPLIRSLAGVSRNPEFAGNDLIQGAIKNVADDIAKWTSSGGVIDAKALDAIRKNSVNAAVRDLLKGQDPSVQREAAASVMTRIRPVLTDAIEAAGGAGYREYLANHTQGMQRIAEKSLAGEALRLWKADKDGFVKLVQNESPETVEKFLGKGNYDIAKELSESAMDTLREQAKRQIMRSGAKEQVSEGQAALRELVRQNVSKFRLPSHLSAWVTNANKSLQILEDAVGKKTLDTLTRALKTPQGAADLLSVLPGEERLRMMELLQNPTKAQAMRNAMLGMYRTMERAPGGVAAGLNALAPESEQEPVNALAE
jgi:hypothetical protein